MKGLNFKITKGQKSGILNLFFLCILAYFGWKFLGNFSNFYKKNQGKEIFEWAKFQTEISQQNPKIHLKEKLNSVQSLSLFDPNELDLEGWKRLNFTLKQANSILKYKQSIGGFSNVFQLEKSFVISKEKFETFKDYVIFKKKSLQISC